MSSLIRTGKHNNHEYYEIFGGNSMTVKNISMGQLKGLLTSCKTYNWILGEGPKAEKGKNQGGLGRNKQGKNEDQVG